MTYLSGIFTRSESSVSSSQNKTWCSRRVSHLLGSSSDIPINMATGHWIMLYLYLILMTGPSFLSAALQQLSLPEFVQLIFFELQHRYVKSCEGSEILPCLQARLPRLKRCWPKMWAFQTGFNCSQHSQQHDLHVHIGAPQGPQGLDRALVDSVPRVCVTVSNPMLRKPCFFKGSR